MPVQPVLAQCWVPKKYFWKEKQTLSFISVDMFSFDLLFIILTFLMWYNQSLATSSISKAVPGWWGQRIMNLKNLHTHAHAHTHVYFTVGSAQFVSYLGWLAETLILALRNCWHGLSLHAPLLQRELGLPQCGAIMGWGGTSGCTCSVWLPGLSSVHMASHAGKGAHLLWSWCPEVLFGDCVWASCSITVKNLIFPCAAEVALDVHTETHAISVRLLLLHGMLR